MKVSNGPSLRRIAVIVHERDRRAVTQWNHRSCNRCYRDHVRQYGRDFTNRLRSVWFDVSAERSLLEPDIEGRCSDGTYPMRHYICRKPVDSAHTTKDGDATS